MDITVNQENKELALAFLAQIREKKKILEAQKGVKVKLQDSDEYLTIPQEAFSMLIQFISEMAEGEKVFDLKEAAQILFLEKEDVLKLVKNEILTAKKLKNNYYFRQKTLLSYREERDKKRRILLDEIAKDSQEMELY